MHRRAVSVLSDLNSLKQLVFLVGNIFYFWMGKYIRINKWISLLRPLLSRRSKLSLNTLTIYKMILLPTSTYAMASNIVRIQRFQSEVLRSILDAPWYASNHTIHTDLNIPFISDLIKTRFQQFHSRLAIHPNPLAQALSSPHHPLHPPRRLNRQWPRDLLWVLKDDRKCHWWVASSLSIYWTDNIFFSWLYN
jgi:hypothetical protein